MRDIISFLIGMSSKATDYVGCEDLRAQPIAVSIETKTESYRGRYNWMCGWRRRSYGLGHSWGTHEAAGPISIEKLPAEARSSRLNRTWSHKVDEKAAGEVT